MIGAIASLWREKWSVPREAAMYLKGPGLMLDATISPPLRSSLVVLEPCLISRLASVSPSGFVLY